MSSLFPIINKVEVDDERAPFLLDIRNDEADMVFSALASSTSRNILAILYEEPTTASQLAQHIDTTLQNIQYHLRNLTEAKLVEVVDTWYSERGTKMKVYAPSGGAMILFAGAQPTDQLRQQLKRLFGGGLILGFSVVLLRSITIIAQNGGGDAIEEEVDQSLGEMVISEWTPLILDATILVLLGGLLVLVILLILNSFNKT